MAESIRLEYPNEEHVRLILARPERKNAMGIAELKALAEVARRLEQRSPRVLSILAEGSSFGVGGDIQAFGHALSDGKMGSWLREAIGHFNVAISGLRSLDTAIVVGIQGAVAGGSLGLVWAADHVIAADNLALNLAYAKLGGSPDGGTSWFLQRLLNPLRAFELFTLTPTLSASKALDWGLVNQVVSPESLNATVDAIANAWLAVPPQSLRNFKRLLRASSGNTLSEQLQQEMEAFVLAGDHPIFAEKVAAFLGK